MTGGDGEHPRRRFRNRLDELFDVAELTNDRVAKLAGQLFQNRRIQGVTVEDYQGSSPANTRRLSEWRHPSEPAVPQRWVQLAAVLTVLIEKARPRAPQRVDLYDRAAWRRLYEEALKSPRPAKTTDPVAPRAAGIGLDQAVPHDNDASDGDDRPRRPYSVIGPTGGKPDWRTLLDGSALPAAFGLAGTLERTVVVDDVPYDAAGMLAWLAGHPGRTVFLGGNRGDGKTSYLNMLAARSVGSHHFVRWTQNAPFSMRTAENLAAEFHRANLTERPTVVIVYPIDASGSSADLGQLGDELAAGVGGDDRRTVVVIEGDDGARERLPFYTAHPATLLPPGPESVQPWVSLLGRAHDELRREGEEERQIAARYPNLVHFLGSNAEQQAEILADTQSPMIVRLLRAVYGADMWGKLYDELRRLQPPSPDAMCYLGICLASVANRGVPTAIVEELQPRAEWQLRSLRDPWVLDEEDEHVARHRVIAQVVLEKAARSSNGRLIRQCLSDYAAHFRTPRYGALVRQIVMAVAHLPPVGSEKETEGLRRAVFSGARGGLQAIDDVAGAIKAECGRDYRALAAWMEIVRLLVPRQSRDRSHLWLVELHETLLDAVDDTDNPPEPDRLIYYHWKIGRLRAWLLNEDDYDFLDDAVRQIAPFIGAPWCRADFYTDLFRWCFQALSHRRSETLTGRDAIDVRFLYATLFTAYERLRSCTTDDRLSDIRRDFNTMMLRYVHWQLPDDAADLIDEAWKTSVMLGRPDPQLGTILAEMLLEGRATPPPGEDAVTSACRTLAAVLDAATDHGEALFLLALAHVRHGVEVDSLPGRIAGAGRTEDSELNPAFLAHAAALIESDAARRKALLLDASREYAGYIEALGSGSYAADRLGFAYGLAVTDLARFDGPDVEQARRRHRRLTG
ncbi:hypothetical protein [Micromonospora sp. CPCC 205561]|uniref:hypothetical protein n=1 Tax=Micromonospora sp. CPCC 205561 TaxID=3122407 RepID=UPI002FF29936